MGLGRRRNPLLAYSVMQEFIRSRSDFGASARSISPSHSTVSAVAGLYIWRVPGLSPSKNPQPDRSSAGISRSAFLPEVSISLGSQYLLRTIQQVYDPAWGDDFSPWESQPNQN